MLIVLCTLQINIWKKKKKEAISFVFLKLYHVFLQNSFYFEISYCFVLKLSSF